MAAIRDNDFLIDGGYTGINEIITPENINIDEIFSIALENVVRFNHFSFLDVCLTVFKTEQSADIIGMPFMDIGIPECSVIAVYRDNDPSPTFNPLRPILATRSSSSGSTDP